MGISEACECICFAHNSLVLLIFRDCRDIHKVHTKRRLYSTQLYLNTLGIYSWSEIQLIPILEGEVERISQHPPTTQTNSQVLVCIINEALSLTPPFNAYIKNITIMKSQLQDIQYFNFVWHGLHQLLHPL